MSHSALDLIKLLQTKVVQFKYVTKQGEERTAYGTNDLNRIPTNFRYKNDLTNSTNYMYTSPIAYFDIEKKGIRTVYNVDSIKIIDSFDVPLER